VRTQTLRSFLALLTLGTVACGGGDDGGYQPPAGTIDAPGSDARPPGDAPSDAPPGDGPPSDGPPSGDGGSSTGAPEITIVSPAPGTLVSGTVALEVTITDDDGVASASATVGTSTITLTKQANSDTWVGNLNTLPLAGLIAPTVIVRASDTQGEMAQVGFSLVLDNEPPVASLDSPRVRTMRLDGTTKLCSVDFDPLGSDAPDDRTAVPQLIELRARVRDVPNTGTLNSSLFIPRAGTESVQLFVFDDTSKPLVVDTNADGVCDAINPTIVPKTTPMLANEAATLTLAAVTPAGDGVYAPDMFGGSNGALCTAGDQMDSGEPLCLGEASTTVAIHTPFTDQPEIFGIPPAAGGNCLGFAFDVRASNISEGWACAAVKVTDALGNSSVSAPLRICVDSNGDLSNGCSAWGTVSANPPNCTGTLSGGVVNTTPCTPRDFFRSTTPDEYEVLEP
jgi:hypothetical protein